MLNVALAGGRMEAKLVLWASVSDEVAERLAAGTTKLRPQDWKSGDKLWVVEVIAPFGGTRSDRPSAYPRGRESAAQERQEMFKDLKEKVFPAKEIYFLAVNKDGKQIRVL
jgi:hemolysin-activating ACP:hemolysin acyltransferase